MHDQRIRFLTVDARTKRTRPAPEGEWVLCGVCVQAILKSHCKFLASTAYFERTSASVLQRYAHLCDSRTLERGQHVLQAGKRTDFVYLIEVRPPCHYVHLFLRALIARHWSTSHTWMKSWRIVSTYSGILLSIQFGSRVSKSVLDG
eukprot:288017-Pyramimonas_sp.AAC.1